MEYRTLGRLDPDSAQARELVYAINEVNGTLATHARLLNREGLAYVQAIVDEIFERVLPQRAYRVTVRICKTGVTLDIQEPILMLQHEK